MPSWAQLEVENHRELFGFVLVLVWLLLLDIKSYWSMLASRVIFFILVEQKYYSYC